MFIFPALQYPRESLLSGPVHHFRRGSILTPSSRYVYVPDTVKSDALVIVIHSCQSTAESYSRNSKIPWKQGSDKKGYITIWPSSPHSGTCWDVSSKGSLSHLGGGDTQAIANMILWAIPQYKIDPKKVFVTGGSSGGTWSSRNFFRQRRRV